jgi:hypothetical protein
MRSGRYILGRIQIAFDKLKEPASSHSHSHSDDSGSGSEEDDVIVLTDDEFDEKVMNDEGPWFIEFYAPWVMTSLNEVRTLQESRSGMGYPRN